MTPEAAAPRATLPRRAVDTLRPVWSAAVSREKSLDEFLSEPSGWRKACFIARQFLAQPEYSALSVAVWSFAVTYVLSAFRAVWLALLGVLAFEVVTLIVCESYEEGCWSASVRGIAFVCGIAGVLFGFLLRTWRSTGHGGPLYPPCAAPRLGAWAIIALPAALVALLVGMFAANGDRVVELCRCTSDRVVAQAGTAFLCVFTWGMLTAPVVP